MSYKCSYCKRRFRKPETKYRHMIRVHAKKYREDLTPEGWERIVRRFGKK